MPRRDPKTGKFVSGGGALDWSDVTVINGEYHSEIPAADLAGGKTSVTVDGDSTELIDFTPLLASDEVYVIDSCRINAVLAGPTSATAEGSMFVTYALGGDSSGGGGIPQFYGGSTHKEDGIVDIKQGSGEISPRWYTDQLAGTPSMRDTATGTAGGSDWGSHDDWVHFSTLLGARGPVYDRDDEIYLPHQIAVDGIDDHAVQASWTVTLYGTVDEV